MASAGIDVGLAVRMAKGGTNFAHLPAKRPIGTDSTRDVTCVYSLSFLLCFYFLEPSARISAHNSIPRETCCRHKLIDSCASLALNPSREYDP